MQDQHFTSIFPVYRVSGKMRPVAKYSEDCHRKIVTLIAAIVQQHVNLDITGSLYLQVTGTLTSGRKNCAEKHIGGVAVLDNLSLF